MALTQELLSKIKNNEVGAILDLQEQDLSDGDLAALKEAISSNNSIQLINLSHNEYLSDNAIKQFLDVLIDNSTIHSIDFSETDVGRQTAERLDSILETHAVLTSLRGLPSINDVAQTLKEGKSKTEFIDLLNRIETKMTYNLVNQAFTSFKSIGELSREVISDNLASLEARHPEIKRHLDNNDDGGHYIPEAYRLLTGLFCMSLGSDQSNASVKAFTYLTYPYETNLQEIANLALAQYLYYDVTLNKASAPIQEARYQWLLHALRSEVDKPQSPWQYMLPYAMARLQNKGAESSRNEMGLFTAIPKQQDVDQAMKAVDPANVMQVVARYLNANATPSVTSSSSHFFANSATPSEAPTLKASSKKI